MNARKKILEKIEEFEKRVKYWKDRQINFKWTEETIKEGDPSFVMCQDFEHSFKEKILLLQWVLDLIKDENN
jgi:hypothetical protein